ncbi:hypothetical protein LXL04_002775 [Taraxacum kok-saghyz]
MVFGRIKNGDSQTVLAHSDSETEGTHISDTQDRTIMDVDVEVEQQTTPTNSVQQTARVVEVLNSGPVTTVKATPVGKKAEIKRCPVLGKSNPYYDTLYNRVKEAEKNGVAAKSLKNSVLLKNTSSKRKIEDTFRMLERDEVDMKIVRGLCANGIPFNVLRNPQFLEMIQAIQKALEGIYALAGTQADAVTMDAIDWWATYGAETLDLADVAKRVLSQPISSSSAERNWSTYSHIHSVKRNRLNGPRADKLVFIHSNIRLLSRFSEAYKAGPNKK